MFAPTGFSSSLCLEGFLKVWIPAMLDTALLASIASE
jgi:hypothetical protein